MLEARPDESQLLHCSWCSRYRIDGDWIAAEREAVAGRVVIDGAMCPDCCESFIRDTDG